MSVRGPEVVQDDGVELAMALSADHLDEVFILLELPISVFTLRIALPQV
jgi:hypothetical protein